jgi:preprotein translocase subunit SecA
MNSQREVVYSQRRHALMGERIGVDITNMIYDTSDNIVEIAKNSGDFEELEIDLLKVLAMDVPFNEEDFNNSKINDLSNKVSEATMETFKRKMEKLASIAFPVIKQVYEQKGQQYENILIPVSDGKRVFNITAHLETAYKTEAREVVKAFEKQTLLYVIDDEWKEHLRQLDELRNSVQNASYEQKDPLLIYKLESFGLFKEMIDTMNRKVLAILMRGQIPMREPEQVREARPSQRMDLSKYKTQKDEVGRGNGDPTKQDTREPQHHEPIRVEKKVGRNDPCPCGSGKKYKNCHGAN